jgi:crotonobetainyl-CoA:carnitine CoA-transferase CaiB-like acyl-CoA transferase
VNIGIVEDVISDDKVLSGVRVLEVAAWTFARSAGAVLAEWGVEVIKVEPRKGGDPQRQFEEKPVVPPARPNTVSTQRSC